MTASRGDIVDSTTTPPTIVRGSDADALALAAYDQLSTLLLELRRPDWDVVTECRPWTVRDMVAHMVGAAEGHASLPVMLRQTVGGMRLKNEFDGNSLDAMNELQIRSQKDSSGPQLAARIRDLAPLAVRGRHRRATWMGFVPISIDPTGSTAGFPAKVSMGHLCAVVLTRDVWMHKFDIARALDMTPPIDDTDTRVVADVAAEWQGQHKQPVRLELSGPAGGSYQWGSGGPILDVDAIDFCRVVAGRRPDSTVPASPLLDTRILF